jgi:co-chaperonin GroES (HSP10)
MTALAFEASRPKALTEIPRPCGWRVLVAMVPVEQRSSGGILLPDSHLDQKQAVATTGYVIAVGPQAYKRPDTGEIPWADPGDKVLVAKYAGQRHDIKSDARAIELRIINDDEIQAVFPIGHDHGGGVPAELPSWVMALLKSAR